MHWLLGKARPNPVIKWYLARLDILRGSGRSAAHYNIFILWCVSLSTTLPYSRSPKGSAVYIFFFTLPRIDGSAEETHINITLDGQAGGVYNYAPSLTDSYRYNVPVYSNPQIPVGQHSIVISAEVRSVMEFDYAVYSFVYYILKVHLNC